MPAEPIICQSTGHTLNDAGVDRRGSAPLELVLSMPILLALIVAIVWLGSSVIAQTEVTIDARHKTWSRRDESTGTPLLFLKDDIVSDKSTQTVEVSPLFNDVDSPESSHVVMASSWDHEQLSLDNAPNWEQFALAAANAKTGSIQNGYTDARNQFSQFKNESSKIWQTLGASMIRQLTSLGNSVSSALEGGEAAGAGEKAKEESRLNRAIEAKKAELKRARKELKNLDDEASDATSDVLKNRIKRLKTEVDDLESDLEALE